MLHESVLGNGIVEQSADESWCISGSTGVSCRLHGDGLERFDQALESSEISMEI